MKVRLTLVVSLVSLFSCTKNTDTKTSTPCVNTCTPGPCTDDYHDLALKIRYRDGSVCQLDSFKTTRNEDGQLLDPAIQYRPQSYVDNGEYPVFNDNFISLTNQCGKAFTFTGYKNNMEVVRENYVFSHDCCHMRLVSGVAVLIK